MFGRRRSGAEEAEAAEPTKEGGKGRPTPTRKEAEAARKARLAAPKTGKEARARQRDQVRQQRSKTREAMNSGDERYLPARDKGPVKRYVRDWIDSHRTIGEFLLPIFFVAFILLYVIQTAALGTYAWLFIILAMVVDSVRVVRGVKAGIRERFGEAETKGITWYALTRAWQMRRLRLPKPQVSVGDKI